MFRIALILLAVAGAALYAAMPGSGADYAVGMREAQRLLVASDLPLFVFGSQAPTFEARADGGQVQWIAKRRGVELFRYIATLTEAGDDRTRVELDLKGSEEGGVESTASRFAAKPSIRNLYIIAMQEQIAATLEKRSYDMARIASATVVASAENMTSLRASADQAATASNQRARDAIQRAYREEAAGRR